MALVDEARALLAERPRSFGHVIVDEAQDLTPMQLRMVARRAASGSLTILGDIAQATGPVSYDGWGDVLAHLPGEERRRRGAPPRLSGAGRDHGARAAAPRLGSPPTSRRPSPSAAEARHRASNASPRVTSSRRRCARRVGWRREEGLLAVILPDALVPDFEGASAYDDGIPLLSPRRAKGLEFDHVVVVEPALIAEGETGLRELYVALTRPTRTLVVVHARPLPEELDVRVA